jgi:hypothetical protein
LNGYLNYPEGSRIPRLEALLTALARTSSRTLPLWLMDTQEGEVRIAARAARAGAADPRTEYLLAVDAVARRDYRACAERLERLRSRYPPYPRFVTLRAIALHLAGDRAGGSAEIASACASGPSPVLDGETCAWLQRTFPAAP